MPVPNRICYTCNTGYYHCPTCPSKGHNESYYNMFCCERCSKIFKILTEETFKRLTSVECKKELLNLNVTRNEIFRENIKKHIDRILDTNDEKIKLDDIGIDNSEKEIAKMVTPRRTKRKKNSEVD